MPEARLGDTVAVLPSAARTATPTIGNYDIQHGSATGAIVIIDVTAVTSTPSTVFSLLGVDPVSGKTWLILASAAVATVSTVVLRVSPQLTAAANLIAKDVMPDSFTITAVHGNANSMTYSVAVQLVA